jgi:peptidyl-prolyl cis-trans isomerase B (cyclophilin B)
MKKTARLLLAAIMCLALFGCSDNGFMKEKDIKTLEKNPTGTIVLSFNEDDSQQPRTFTLQFELYYDKAPITVTNFVKLVSDDFYDDTFCMSGNTADGSAYLNVDCYEDKEDENGNKSREQKTVDYYIKGEFSNNGWELNDKSHVFGALSMLTDSGYDTAGAYFSIILNEDSEHLDGYRAVFGKLTDIDSGFLQAFLKLGDISDYEFKIVSITVDTHGVDLGEPRKLKKD